MKHEVKSTSQHCLNVEVYYASTNQISKKYIMYVKNNVTANILYFLAYTKPTSCQNNNQLNYKKITVSCCF